MSLLTSVLKLWRTGQYLLPADSGFSPKHLFAGGRVGWWLDPLDFGYARQDSAGATAYTAVEQGVGKIIDKSPNALVFTQATSAARPVVSARVNGFTKSEDFLAAEWGSTGTRTGGQLDSRGGNNAVLIESPFPYILTRSVVATATALTYRIAIKGVSGSTLSLLLRNGTTGANSASGYVDIATGNISGAGWTSVPIQNGFVEYSFTSSIPISPGDSVALYYGATGANPAAGTRFICDYASLTGMSRVNLPYQRVNTATDYDTAGFPHYLKFDGAATHLVGASGGGATAGFYFGAAVQFGKVGAVQTIVSDAGTNTGFKIRTTAANQIEISAGNGAAFTAVNTTEAFAAGDVAFIELFDNGTNLSACLGNGTPVTVARPAVSAGTAQMTLAKDNNAASNYAGISIFSAVYIKDYCPSAAQRADYKRWALQRAGVAS